jgi:uncharacterized protein (TIGR02569 family)
MGPPPPASVLTAFGINERSVVPVRGGQGSTYRAGALALKPCPSPAEAEWLGAVLETIVEDGFRIAKPVRASSGAFVEGGWCAAEWLAGEATLANNWDEAIRALRAFHRALRGVKCPSLLGQRQDLYTAADRLVWEDPSCGGRCLGPAARRLRARYRPIQFSSQVIHGDPSEGNLLFAPGVPAAIIDVAAFCRPAEYSVALLISDGIAWSSGPPTLLDQVRDVPAMDQLLLRAVLFRLEVAARFGSRDIAAYERGYAPVVAAVERWHQDHISPVPGPLDG